MQNKQEAFTRAQNFARTKFETCLVIYENGKYEIVTVNNYHKHYRDFKIVTSFSHYGLEIPYSIIETEQLGRELKTLELSSKIIEFEAFINGATATREDKLTKIVEITEILSELHDKQFYRTVPVELIYNNFPFLIYDSFDGNPIFEKLPMLHEITEIREHYKNGVRNIKLYCGQCRRIVSIYEKDEMAKCLISVPWSELQRISE